MSESVPDMNTIVTSIQPIVPAPITRVVVILEALIAILIFPASLLGLIGIQASAIGLSIDAKIVLTRRFLPIRSSPRCGQTTNLASFAHHPGCGLPLRERHPRIPKVPQRNGGGSWTHQVAQSLPGAAENLQRIVVNADRTVEIGICWKRPQDAAWHHYVTATQIN